MHCNSERPQELNMKRVTIALVCTILGYFGPSNAADELPYRVNSGDTLTIAVWEDESLTGSVLVAPDGKCTFPLIGEFVAKGRAVSEITDELTRRLVRYIPDPIVTVSLADISGNKIYVMGQVASPGSYVMNPSLDVMQALSVAGGTTPFADLKSIKILRRTEEGQTALNFRYDEVVRGRDIDQNILLQSGDVVVVP